MTTPSIDQQIAEIKREIALRNAVYPGFVSKGRLKQDAAERQIANMTAALQTLMKGRDQ
jgi:hypothetical protein